MWHDDIQGMVMKLREIQRFLDYGHSQGNTTEKKRREKLLRSLGVNLRKYTCNTCIFIWTHARAPSLNGEHVHVCIYVH